ncbi:sulfurtransferase TusA [mine drainage metagenome]|uniref:Sulfurtransferase TusA n=1 Tax=mine drainage metagenome TaxID=410659 RepID=A0A1J5QC39_9ZZZZ
MTFTVDQLGGLKVDEIVDARGTSCPGPILAAKKAIGRVPAEGIMEVMATDSGTLKDLPAWCKKMGHEYLGSLEEPGYLCLYLKKVS